MLVRVVLEAIETLVAAEWHAKNVQRSRISKYDCYSNRRQQKSNYRPQTNRNVPIFNYIERMTTASETNWNTTNWNAYFTACCNRHGRWLAQWYRARLHTTWNWVRLETATNGNQWETRLWLEFEHLVQSNVGHPDEAIMVNGHSVRKIKQRCAPWVEHFSIGRIQLEYRIHINWPNVLELVMIRFVEGSNLRRT